MYNGFLWGYPKVNLLGINQSMILILVQFLRAVMQLCLFYSSKISVKCVLQKKEKLSGFLMWALSTALKSDSLRIFRHKVSPVIISEETPSDESLISKLLRWLVAAVILGKLSWKLNDVNSTYSERSSLKSLQSFLEYVEVTSGGRNNRKFDCEEVLAETIIFLQQLLGSTSRVLSSAVSALCLLLFCSPFKCSGMLV